MNHPKLKFMLHDHLAQAVETPSFLDLMPKDISLIGVRGHTVSVFLSKEGERKLEIEPDPVWKEIQLADMEYAGVSEEHPSGE